MARKNKNTSAANVIQMPMCRVCGKPVSSKDVAFGVVDQPLFYAHDGDCAEVIAGTTETIGKLTRILLESKHPEFLKQAKRGIDKLQRLARILAE